MTTILEQILQYTSLATFVLMTLAVVFSIWDRYNRDKNSTGKEISNTEKSDIALASKIELLETKITGELKGFTNAMLVEVRSLTDAFHLIKQNDLHSIYEKQRDQDSQINKLTVAVTELKTIIDERVPRKITSGL